jgi:RNA polymerase sigma factor (sigma-70 family)
MDHFRARRRVQTEDEVPEQPGQEESSAEEQAMDSLGQAGMLALIERLSDEQRQVLTLKFLFGFANAEVAGILGKTEGAVKSLQHRALASLQRHVSPA